VTRRKSKIRSCTVINPPTSPEEQAALDIRVAKALAQGIYRTLGPEKAGELLAHIM